MILLVDDQETLLRAIKRMLEKHDFVVLATTSANEAIELAAKHAGEIRLLVTDVLMPGMNGWDLAKNLLATHPHLKCLFMSGYTAGIVLDESALGRGVNFVQKPFGVGSFL